MNFPAELKYSRDHEWVKMLDDTTALVGITDFAQSELGDLVYVNLPEPGDEVLVPEPGFPNYKILIKQLGSVPIPYHLRPERDWQPDPEEIERLSRLEYENYLASQKR